MMGWSISRAAIAAALVSVTAVTAVAQDSEAQSTPGGSPGYHTDAQQDDDSTAPPDQDQGQPADDGGQNDGGFASRDAPPPADTDAPRPRDDAHDWRVWRSSPAPIRSEDPNAGLPSADAPPSGQPQPADSDTLDARPQQAPGTINSFNQPESAPGAAATSGIDNRDQAVGSCLAAVRNRIGGGAGAARVDGINGEWMVSGAIGDGRAFYCSIRHGAVDDIEFGS